MSHRMRKMLYTLLMSILFLLIILILLIFHKIQPEGEYITKDEMTVLTELVNTVWNEYIEGGTEDIDSIQIQKETMYSG